MLAIVNTDGESVEMLGAGEKGLVVLDTTPFYALSGGQVGDTGIIENAGSVFEVYDTTKNDDSVYLHSGAVKEGVISVGDAVEAKLDERKRRSIMRNHTAAHLLQAALREVLGTHVEQAGQLVDENIVRFDFTHFNAMSEEEIAKVEYIVNKFILSATPVEMLEMPIEDAKKMGAMMLFGEKYGDIVRVVKAGDFSTEFCGGTHVSNSGELGLFKIVSEASVASGVRRITALTGMNLMNRIKQFELNMKAISSAVKANEGFVIEKVTGLVGELKDSQKKINELEAEITRLKSADMFSKPVEIDGIEVFTAKLDSATPDALRSMGDDVKANNDNAVAVIAGVNGEKATIVAVCGKNAVAKGVKAGDVVREVAKLAGGGGGGRPDSAMAGAKDLSKLDEAVKATVSIVENILK